MDIKDPNTTELELLVEEFKALRAEIILCLERRVTIISYGLATVGVLTLAAVTSLNGSAGQLAAAVILSAVIPAVSLYVVRIWLTETHRVRRASHYVGGLELRAKELTGRNLLRWEQGIRAKDQVTQHFSEQYVWTVFFFTFMSGISVAVGLILLQSYIDLEQFVYILGGAVGLAFFFLFFVRWKHEADWLIQTYNRPPAITDLPAMPSSKFDKGAV